MARYIDADKVMEKISHITVTVMGGRSNEKTIFGKALNSYREEVLKRIEDAPTADVVPKSEVEELISENSSLAKTVNEASDLIRKLRSKLKKSKAEVAREIFEEIEKISCRISNSDANGNMRIVCYQLSSEKLAELKKKYTEGGNAHEN